MTSIDVICSPRVNDDPIPIQSIDYPFNIVTVLFFSFRKYDDVVNVTITAIVNNIIKYYRKDPLKYLCAVLNPPECV